MMKRKRKKSKSSSIISKACKVRRTKSNLALRTSYNLKKEALWLSKLSYKSKAHLLVRKTEVGRVEV